MAPALSHVGQYHEVVPYTDIRVRHVRTGPSRPGGDYVLLLDAGLSPPRKQSRSRRGTPTRRRGGQAARRLRRARARRALPAWALKTLADHADDERECTYATTEWEAGATHDPLWNAAQRELVATGTIHNYVRMLWGKKVIEWSRTPEEAYRTLVHLNNKYALDGRDPNSWSGIPWCFGLFDRPWAPERRVLGRIRYLSSANTAKKFRLGPYLAYVDRLPKPA